MHEVIGLTTGLAAELFKSAAVRFDRSRIHKTDDNIMTMICILFELESGNSLTAAERIILGRTLLGEILPVDCATMTREKSE